MLDALPEAERRAAVIEKGPDGHTLLMAACQYHAEVCFAKLAGACGTDVDDCTVTVLALCSRLLPRFLNGGLIHMKSMNGAHLVAIWRWQRAIQVQSIFWRYVKTVLLRSTPLQTFACSLIAVRENFRSPVTTFLQDDLDLVSSV